MDLLQSSLEIITKAETSLDEGVLNERQCRNLLRNLLGGLGNIQSIIGCSCTNVLDGAKEDLFRIVSNSRALIEDCCKKDWLKAAVVQIDNKEAFRELLTDLDCCFDTICDICQCCYPDRVEEIKEVRRCTTFFPTSIDKVDEDLKSIDKRLYCFDKEQSCASRDVELARYLRGRMSGLRKAKGGGLGIIVSPDDYPHPEYESPPARLGGSGDGLVSVYATKWLGLESATKVILMSDKSEKWKKSVLIEAGILGGLSHPNIIKLFCCGFSKGREKFELVMERGKMTLSKMLEERSPLPEPIAMNVMLQIATGMCYMHDMKVAHRDLKPDNVVVNSKDGSEGTDEAHVHVKLLDFGVSIHEVKNTPQVPTAGNIGTVGYMAPEAIKEKGVGISLPKMDALKADVFSFGMMCSEIVSGTKPFGGKCSLQAYLAKIKNGKRPRLPDACPQELRLLIKNCWSWNPSERPTFLKINTELRRLKKAMAQCSLERRENLGSSDQVVNEARNKMSEARKLVGVERTIIELECKLQNVGSLGIIGTGGIGKSTLAKALSSHISHKFDATYFVDDLKDGKCKLTLRDKLKDLQERPQIHSLREGQGILERVRKTKKVLIVLDDVGSECRLHELLGVDRFKDDDGSKLIATSCTWKSLEQHVPVHGKVDMAVLDRAESRELFAMHAFATNQPCLPYLEDVAEKIVNACDGLPLSLEVMGTHLHGNQRLRIWERTLYRLLRARDDGSGDEKIWKTLKISFDDLKNDEKSMFLL